MKGFIELTLIDDTKVTINLSNITDFGLNKEDGFVYIGFATTKNDIAPVKETYEEIKELIKKSYTLWE